MFRKTTLALAVATLAATAAIPTAASASGWRDGGHDGSRHHDGWRGHDGWRDHHRHHSGFAVRYSAPYYAYAPSCYTTKRWVRSHWGWRPVFVRHCR